MLNRLTNAIFLWFILSCLGVSAQPKFEVGFGLFGSDITNKAYMQISDTFAIESSLQNDIKIFAGGALKKNINKQFVLEGRITLKREIFLYYVERIEFNDFGSESISYPIGVDQYLLPVTLGLEFMPFNNKYIGITGKCDGNIVIKSKMDLSKEDIRLEKPFLNSLSNVYPSFTYGLFAQYLYLRLSLIKSQSLTSITKPFIIDGVTVDNHIQLSSLAFQISYLF